MSTLADFLKEQKVKQVSTAAELQAKRDEWLASLNRLLDQLKAWLKDADSEGVLEVAPGKEEIDEDLYGRYQAPCLLIRLEGHRKVWVKPRGLNVFAHLGMEYSKGRVRGRVDLVGPDQEYLMYRWVGPEGERWLIVDGYERNVRLLDREIFENALLSLLQ